MKAINLNPDAFDYYVTTFVKYYTRYWIKEEGHHWRAVIKPGRDLPTTIYLPLTKYKIFFHLACNYHIAKQMAGKNDYFVIDLDYKKDRPIEKRYEEMVRTFGLPMVFRSSESGGLHLYYFLEKLEWRWSIRSFIDQVISINSKVTEKPGLIEYFPGSIDHLRLPLGKGSHLLDPIALQPLGLSLNQSIWYVRENRKKATIDLEKKLDYLRKSFRPSQPSLRPSRKIIPEKTAVNEVVKYTISEKPIAEYGTRNQIQMGLIRDCIDRRGLSSAETFNEIWGWYNDPKLDHKSKDLESNPKQVEKELRAAIKNYIGKKGNYRNSGPRVPPAPLSVEDVKFILKMTDQFKEKGKYGRKAYYLQIFLFNLLSHFKTHRKTILPISFGVFSNMKSEVLARRYKTFCQCEGILTLTKESDRATHQCAYYRLNYTFRPGEEYHTLEKAIAGLFALSDLFKTYSRGIYNRLRSLYLLV